MQPHYYCQWLVQVVRLVWPRYAPWRLRPAVAIAGMLVAGWFSAGMIIPRAAAEAIVEGNVLLFDDMNMVFYADDPFTTTVNEGIPRLGNSINENQGNQQTNFEGRPDLMGTADPSDDENVNFDIFVGRTSFGELIINGGTELRDQNMIIGDSAMLPNGQVRRGTGVVRIENPGSLYNNDPAILPFIPTTVVPEGQSPSINPRSDEVGFDVFVGRAGTGQMFISLGGRAEIQDAVVVGDLAGSNGTLTVDGIGSFLGNGGFMVETGGSMDEQHQMTVGRFGSGTMNITNSGIVYSLAPTFTSQQSFVVAGVIGSNEPVDNHASPDLAGQGTVNVDGSGSEWVLGGTLQIGGFHDSQNMSDGMEDMEGDDAFYPAFTGSGTLNVTNGGLVSVVSPVPANVDGTPSNDLPDQLDIWMGYFGELNLDGGRVEIQAAADDQGNGTATREIQRFGLINDGVVTGSGDISLGQFRNRSLGRVRVGASQKLSVAANGRFDISEMDDEEPLQNFGLFEVVGTVDSRAELDFIRTPSNVPGQPDQPVRPFLNQRHATDTGNGGLSEGNIFAQHGTLRFGSGLENHGNVVFTAGDNIVEGDILNDIDGNILIDGNATTLTVEGTITNNGNITIGPNASLLTSLVDVTLLGASSLNMAIGGTGGGPQVSHMSVVGDLMLDGLLEITLFPGPGGSLAPQPGDTFEIMHALGEMTGDFSAITLPFLSPTVGLFAFPNFALDSYFVTAIEAMPGSGSADLNGDGVVDDTDLDIWRQNVGNPGGLGDINGDGIVDGQDFFIWQMQSTAPGSASLADIDLANSTLGGAVPEPSSLALLAVGGVLAMARRRRIC